jgi:hypothetical protein
MVITVDSTLKPLEGYMLVQTGSMTNCSVDPLKTLLKRLLTNRSSNVPDECIQGEKVQTTIV